MKSILRIFFRTRGTRPHLVLLCLVLAGIAEIIGLSTLLPILGELTGSEQQTTSSAGRLALDVVVAIGLEPTIGNLLMFIVVVLCGKAILSFAALSYVGFRVAEVAIVMRSQLLKNVLSARWDYYSGQKVGSISNAMSNDATRAELAFMTAAKFVAQGVQAIVYVVLAMLVDWRLALAGAAIGLMVTAMMNFITGISRRAGNRQTDRTSDLVITVSDTFNNIKALRTMNRYSVFRKSFDSRLKSLKKSLFTLALARESLVHGRQLIAIACMGMVLYIAAVVWRIPLPELVISLFVFFNVIGIIGRMQVKLQSAVELESAYNRLRELIEESGAERENRDGTLQPVFEKACIFDHVSFGFEDGQVLYDVSFTIPAGGITVLHGPSGAGKTTLIDLLTGLHEPHSGSILVDGTPLGEIDAEAWRRSIGYVPQEMNLMHESIRWNVTMGDPRFSDAEVDDALIRAGAGDLMASLPEGIDTVVGERGLRFSGGERQRISLARALVADPKLLILDEVTSALDPDTEAEICANIEALAGDYTIVSITHRPAWVALATNLYRVDAGRVTPADAADFSEAAQPA